MALNFSFSPERMKDRKREIERERERERKKIILMVSLVFYKQ